LPRPVSVAGRGFGKSPLSSGRSKMGAPQSFVTEVHHCIPQCLLRLRDKADAASLDGEGIELWLEYEHEAMCYGVDPDVSREDLAALLDASTVPLQRDEHRCEHVSDFVRWGRRGGLATARRFGTTWFGLLARRRWKRISTEELSTVFAVMNGGGADGRPLPMGPFSSCAYSASSANRVQRAS
jgi:hypothetical protein